MRLTPRGTSRGIVLGLAAAGLVGMAASNHGAPARVVGEVIDDVSGRLVRRQQEGIAVAGSHAIVWDGRDDGGRRLPGGGFFYRLETDGASRTMRVVHIE